MIKVKVCGMRDTLNISEVEDTHPDFMGFIFYPKSPRYVGNNPDPVIFAYPGIAIHKVGVFVNEMPARVVEVAGRYALGFVQLHGAETPEQCRVVRSAGIRVIKAFGIDRLFTWERLGRYEAVCDYFLLDTKSDQHGGTGMKFNWDAIQQYRYEKPFFLSGGIGPDDAGVISAIEHPALYAVDINSRFETAPGVKDVQQVRKFLNEIKSIAK